MARFQIIAKGNICCDEDSKGRTWGFAYTEDQAKDRIDSLAQVGITATYEPINENHWVNNWVG